MPFGAFPLFLTYPFDTDVNIRIRINAPNMRVATFLVMEKSNG
jgi:hypothetical protein